MKKRKSYVSKMRRTGNKMAKAGRRNKTKGLA